MSGVVFVIAGIVLLLFAPVWAALVALLIGGTDLILGLLYRSGRLGASPPGSPEAAQDAASAEPEPPYNPYARED